MVSKIFVSSTIENLKPERELVREAIEKFGFAPLMAEHDFASQPDSPRTACLEGVNQADIYLGILGPSYGFINPATGVSATEEEFNLAQELRKPMLWFVKSGERDARQEDFCRRISDYNTGVLRKEFAERHQLALAVTHALREMETRSLADLRGPTDAAPLLAAVMRQTGERSESPRVIVAAIPQSTSRGVDILTLDTDEFEEEISQRLLFGSGRLFDRRQLAVMKETLPDAVRFEQAPADYGPSRCLVIAPSLAMAAALPAVAERSGMHDYFAHFIIDSRIVDQAVRTLAHLASSIYEKYAAETPFFLNAAIADPQNHYFGVPRKVSSITHPIGRRELPGLLMASKEPLRVGTADDSEAVPGRLVAYLQRHFETAGLSFRPEGQ